MTASLVPSLLTGSAPPANAPPRIASNAPTTSGASGEDPGTFASLLTAAEAATQAGSDAQPPTGGAPTTTSTTTAPPTVTGAPPDAATDGDALLAQLMALMQGIDPSAPPATTGAAATTTELPVLDRPAEAGETTEVPEGAEALDAQGAIEALMAFLVMGQRTPTDPAAMPALPEDVRALLQAMSAPLEGSSTAAASGAPTATGADATVPTLGGLTGIDGTADAADATLGATAEAGMADASTSVDGAAVPVPPVAGSVAPASTGIAETSVAPATAQAVTPDAAGGRDANPDARGDSPATDGIVAEVATRSDGASLSSHDAVAATVAPAAVASAPAIDAPVAPRDVRVVNAAEMSPAVADTVQSAALSGDAEVRLVLNPPDLGHLDVTVATVDGALRVRVEASQAATRDLLEQSMPALHQALEARDLRVERLEVRAADTGRGSLDTSGSGQRSASGGGDGRDGQPDWSPVASFEGVLGPVVKPAQSQTADGRLDVMA